MHSSATVLVFSVLSVFSLVYAAPAPVGELNTLGKRAGEYPCPKDPGCECVDGEYTMPLAVRCGYADRDWHDPGSEPVALGTDNPPRKGKKATATSPEVVIVPDPLKAALLDLGNGHNLLNGDYKMHLIRNRVSWETRGQFVVGLTGYRKPGFKIRGQEFKADRGSARWAIYWDFSWLGPNDAPPATGILGPHVKLVVSYQDQVVNIAYYPLADDTRLSKAAQKGDYYFQHVLQPLRNLTAFDPVTQQYNFPDGEIVASKLLASTWRNLLPEPPQNPSWISNVPPGTCAMPGPEGQIQPSPLWCKPDDTRDPVWQPSS